MARSIKDESSSIWKRIKSLNYLHILLIMKVRRHFEIIDSASTPFRLKLKGAMHIIWNKPSLNKQQKHMGLSIQE